MSSPARKLVSMVPIGLLLAAPVVAQARPADATAHAAAAQTRIKLNTVSSPPRTAAPGTTFKITGKVTNRSRTARTASVRITLRRTKGAFPKAVGRVSLRRIKGHRTAKYTVRVKIPATLAEGRYYVRGCADYGRKTPLENPTAACRFALRRITIKKSATPVAAPKPPASTPAPQPAKPAGPFDILVFTTRNDAVTRAGIEAIDQVADSTRGRGHFKVEAPDPAAAPSYFTDKKLDDYRAVVFLDTGTDSGLTADQKAAFERYYSRGGGFLGIGSAIETDPGWAFLTDVLGTRSAGTGGVAQVATVNVADKVHEASADLPEYWDHPDIYYNFTSNVRGFSHVLATVVEDPFGPQPQGGSLKGMTGGKMGADHPVLWCKDYKNGRSFYSALGNTSTSLRDDDFASLLKGAIDWTAGVANKTTSDCGATVLANYQQTPVTRNPNLEEPIGFDQLPDGRILQTSRRGTVRLHNPTTGTTTTIADLGSTSLPTTLRVYTNSEDGLYGPAIDPDFAQNHWVYLYYAPQTVQNVKLSDGSVVTQTTPNTTVPNSAASPTAWDPYVGYFQLSRFKFVDGATPTLDLSSEQQILRVSNNRQECCHVAGDIDFDKHGNLWMVTGDDTPAGGIRANGFGPFEDELTDEQQVIRLTNATGGTYTLTFNGQTTAPLAFNATAAQVDTALENLSNIDTDEVQTSGGPADTANLNVFFRRAKKGTNQTQITVNGAALTGTAPTAAATTAQEGGWFQRPTGDDRRSTTNTNDLRGKILRINVKGTITSADFNKADTGSGTGAYTIPAGNLRDYAQASYPAVASQTGFAAKFRPEIYAMGFRNPFRIQVDENDVAYITDYSPDSNVPQRGRGPSGVGRVEIVRKPSNYGYPLCYSSKLGYNKWNFQEFAPGTTTVGIPATTPPSNDCGRTDGLPNESRWVRDGGPGFEPGLALTPPVSDPDIWYSYRDNTVPSADGTINALGTPCAAYYAPTPGPIAPGSSTECPRLFPNLFSGGVAPHGAVKYHYDASNPSTTKFPPYYDNKVVIGEFNLHTLREVVLDQQNHVQQINSFLNCTSQAVLASGPTPATPFECTNPMDMQFGADGSFYLMTYGTGFFNINPGAAIFKWSYVKGQRPPVAVIGADKTDGKLPLTVNFSSVGSKTPEPSQSITYSWNFGDGSPASIDPNPSHTYTAAGAYTAVLTVTDSSGRSASASLRITAGNTSPTVVVNTPVEGGTFSFGDNIPYTVTVTDPEDGTINCNDVTVTFVLGHETHGHAEQSKQGCSGVLNTDAGDVSHGGNVFGVISASYTDKGGVGGSPALSTTGQHNIRQKHQEVEFVVSQSGTNTATGNDGGTNASVHRGSLAAGDWIQLNGPFNLVNIGTISYRVADAAAGRTAGSPLGAIEVHQDSLTGPIVQTDNLVSTGGVDTWTTQTFPISLTGTHELFVVFRNVTGGATGSMFNLNWLQFNGQGIGT